MREIGNKEEVIYGVRDYEAPSLRNSRQHREVMHILSKKSLLGAESKKNRVVRIEEENLTNLPISEAEEMETNAKIEILILV